MSLTLAMAGSAIALPRALSSMLLPRVLGLYIAGCAGTIQLLDILVDRLHLDDRIFTFGIVLAIIGIPFAAVAAILADTSRAERSRPAAARQSPGPQPVRDTATMPAPGVSSPGTPAPAAVRTPDAARLHRRLDLILSYHQIMTLTREGDSTIEAEAHRAHVEREVAALTRELNELLD